MAVGEFSRPLAASYLPHLLISSEFAPTKNLTKTLTTAEGITVE